METSVLQPMASTLKKQAETVLQTPTMADVEQIQKWYQDPELAEYFRRFPPLCEWRLPEQTLAGITPGLVIYEGSKLVGLCQLVGYDASVQSTDIGLLVDNSLCTNRKEVSQQAYIQITDYLFGALDYTKLYMKVLPHRTKLIARLQEGGWSIEGRLRDSVKFKGEFKDEILLGLLKKDWQSWKDKY